MALTASRRSGVAASVGATDQAVALVVVAAGSAESSARSVVGEVRVPIAVDRDRPTDTTGVVPDIADTVQPSSRMFARSVVTVARSTMAAAAVRPDFVKPNE